MANTIVSIFVVLLGAVLIGLREGFARLVVETQNEAWGFRFGKREERLSRFVILIVGFGFVVVGTLALLGVIHWKTDAAKPAISLWVGAAIATADR